MNFCTFSLTSVIRVAIRPCSTCHTCQPLRQPIIFASSFSWTTSPEGIHSLNLGAMEVVFVGGGAGGANDWMSQIRKQTRESHMSTL
uniref:Uncharacterized protein n=1 Tax=Aegilops tauschii subsp. strangulata TaxID=200361 RepID=A0A453SL98_AEGTS